MMLKNSNGVKCIVFDFANTLSSDLYFQTQPEFCPNWRELFQKYVFSDKQRLTDWCTGKISTSDIASIMQKHIKIPIDTIIAEMYNGCKNISFNQAVWQFTESQRNIGRKTALVTINMDIFTNIIVPFYGLDRIFDVIINSADYSTDNKLELWQVAYKLFDSNISYNNSLLIDDSDKWVTEFRNCGGEAYRYKNDNEFNQWIISKCNSGCFSVR